MENMEQIHLSDLANLAIGTPEVGAVNFTALHTLLHAFIKHLQIQNVSVQLPCGTRQHPPSGGVLVLKEKNGQVDRMEHRILHLEKQLEALNTLPSGLDLIEISKSGQERGSGAVEDMWQILQLKKRLEVNEEGVSKAMSMLQDLMQVVNTLKHSQRGIEDQTQKVTGTAAMNDLEEKLKVLRKSATGSPENKNSKTSYSVESTPISSPGHVTEVIISDGPILTTSQMTESLTQGSLQAEDPALLVETPHVAQDGMTTTTLKDTEIEMSGEQHERDLTHAAPAAPVPHNTEINPTMTGMDRTAAPGSPGATSQEYAVLHTRIEGLEKGKADRSELGLLQKNTDDLARNLPDLQEKITFLSKEMQDLRWDRDKLEQLHIAMDPIIARHIDQKVKETSQIHQQLGNLSTTVLHIEEELKELHDRQEQEKAIMEQSVTDKSLQIQDQLDKLRGVLTSMASSSSTLLAMSIPQKSDSCTQASIVTAETEMVAQGTIHPQPPVTTSTSKERLTCPACTIDIGNKVSNLVSLYEHLQKLVTDYTSGEVVRKDLQQDGKASDQDTEVIGFIQNTMSKLQEECEHLNRTTKSLIHHHEQKQQHIDILYQEVGKLEKKKADKELIGLEIDVKADKRALESKVVRTHFDASTEHLSRMMQELLGKVSAQEQDWQRLLEKINVEMQNKLDRMEIEPLKNILEERWINLSRQLKERPPQYEADEAAGIRKHLIKRFHCISCDRTVDMMVPGPLMLTIPRIPGLPAHYSSRPHTVFQLSQVRQQSNRLQSGIYQARKEALQLEMSINQLRGIHAHMCKEIARVQLHFGGSNKTPNKTITHQPQTHCATLGKFFQKSRPNCNIDHLPELGNLASMPSSRSCGGSHTLTFSRKRYARLPSNAPSSVQKEDTTDVRLKNEVILGQEGHFYRGRKGNHLQTTKPKDNKRVTSANLKEKENLSEYSTTTSS
ncbi:glutamine-rich protein 2-like isoform X2 [Ranitomeya variabilis]|uniref:glutamine-rich protein 2-like isoform X2 n=1 Tax=Ranitomeya variabilis TaxID=490064 RepID=UPI004055F2AB